MDIISAYREVGTYRGAAAICGTTPKTVKRVIARHEAGGARAGAGAAGAQLRRGRRAGRRAGGEDRRAGSARSGCCRPPGRRATRGRRGTSGGWSRRAKALWRSDNHRGRRPAVWSPGEHLVIDWGVLGGLHVFCAVLAWSRVRFVRFAADERADTTLALLAECFEALGGVPGVVLADRMGCLKGGVVANVVVPTAGLRAVRHALRVPARLLRGRRPGVEGHRGEPGRLRQDRPDDPRRSTGPATRSPTSRRRTPRPRRGVSRSTPRCTPRSARSRPSGWSSSGSCWPPLPSLRAGIGRVGDPQGRPALVCPVRVGPLLGAGPADRRRRSRLRVETTTGRWRSSPVPVRARWSPSTGWSRRARRRILDEHYGGPRPAPRRAVRPKTVAEKAFCALGPGRGGVPHRCRRGREHPAGRRSWPS